MDNQNLENEEEVNVNTDVNENTHTLTINGWDEQTVQTVRQWQNDLEESSFIYGERLEYNEKFMNIYLIIPLIATSLITVFAGVTISLNAQKVVSHWIPFSFEIIILLGAGTASVCTSLIKILGIEDNIKKLTKYIERLDFQWAIFETELSIPATQRLSGPEFLRKENGNYMHITQQAPHISTSDYLCAKQTYLQKMQDFQNWEREINGNEN